jgi:hypothetical protein
VISRWRRWRLEKAELALADEKHHRSKWGWSYKPSRWAESDRLLERLEKKVARLSGEES